MLKTGDVITLPGRERVRLLGSHSRDDSTLDVPGTLQCLHARVVDGSSDLPSGTVMAFWLIDPKQRPNGCDFQMS